MILQFGPRVVEVEFEDPSTARDAHDVLSAWQVRKAPDDTFAVQTGTTTHDYRRNGEHWFSSDKNVHPLPHLLRALWGAIALDFGPCLHAALLSSNSRPVLVIGTSGQGKSTLARLLVERGLDYLTDEISYCDDSCAEWFGVGKPLSYKASHRLFPIESLGYGPFSTPDKGDIFYWNPEEIPLDSRGRANGDLLVVFPEFDPSAETSTVELRQAALIHRSLTHFFDTGQTLEERASWLLRAFGDAEGICLHYRDAEQAADLIRDRVSRD